MLGFGPLVSQPLGGVFTFNVTHAVASQSFAPFALSATGVAIIEESAAESFAPFAQIATVALVVKESSATQTIGVFGGAEAGAAVVKAAANQTTAIMTSGPEVGLEIVKATTVFYDPLLVVAGQQLGGYIVYPTINPAQILDLPTSAQGEAPVKTNGAQNFELPSHGASGHSVPVPAWTIEHVKIVPANRTVKIEPPTRATINAGPSRMVHIARNDRTVAVLADWRSVKIPAIKPVSIPFERRTLRIRRAA